MKIKKRCQVALLQVLTKEGVGLIQRAEVFTLEQLLQFAHDRRHDALAFIGSVFLSAQYFLYLSPLPQGQGPFLPFFHVRSPFFSASNGYARQQPPNRLSASDDTS